MSSALLWYPQLQSRATMLLLSVLSSTSCTTITKPADRKFSRLVVDASIASDGAMSHESVNRPPDAKSATRSITRPSVRCAWRLLTQLLGLNPEAEPSASPDHHNLLFRQHANCFPPNCSCHNSSPKRTPQLHWTSSWMVEARNHTLVNVHDTCSSWNLLVSRHSQSQLLTPAR